MFTVEFRTADFSNWVFEEADSVTVAMGFGKIDVVLHRKGDGDIRRTVFSEPAPTEFFSAVIKNSAGTTVETVRGPIYRGTLRTAS